MKTYMVRIDSGLKKLIKQEQQNSKRRLTFPQASKVLASKMRGKLK